MVIYSKTSAIFVRCKLQLFIMGGIVAPVHPNFFIPGATAHPAFKRVLIFNMRISVKNTRSTTLSKNFVNDSIELYLL